MASSGGMHRRVDFRLQIIPVATLFVAGQSIQLCWGNVQPLGNIPVVWDLCGQHIGGQVASPPLPRSPISGNAFSSRVLPSVFTGGKSRIEYSGALEMLLADFPRSPAGSSRTPVSVRFIQPSKVEVGSGFQKAFQDIADLR